MGRVIVPLSSWSLWCLVLCAPGCVFIRADVNPFRPRPEPLVEMTVSGEGREKILLIDLSRVITSVPPRSLLAADAAPSLVARAQAELDRAARDPRVRAVVLRINSPGGTVTASDTLYHQIREFRSRTRRPIVAHLGDMGTSGAYYVALAADEILANPTCVTGSIGVILMGVNLSGLMSKLGITNQTLKSSDLKDAGSPLRPMEAQERQLLAGILQGMHERFVATLRERRPRMSEQAVSLVQDGRVVLAPHAAELGLIDQVGYLDDAIGRARALAGLEKARVVMYRRPSQFGENIYSLAGHGPPRVGGIYFDFRAVSEPPEFFYLWTPGLGVGEQAILAY